MLLCTVNMYPKSCFSKCFKLLSAHGDNDMYSNSLCTSNLGSKHQPHKWLSVRWSWRTQSCALSVWSQCCNFRGRRKGFQKTDLWRSQWLTTKHHPVVTVNSPCWVDFSVCSLQETPTTSSANWPGPRTPAKNVLCRHFCKKSIRTSARSLALRDLKKKKAFMSLTAQCCKS